MTEIISCYFCIQSDPPKPADITILPDSKDEFSCCGECFFAFSTHCLLPPAMSQSVSGKFGVERFLSKKFVDGIVDAVHTELIDDDECDSSYFRAARTLLDWGAVHEWNLPPRVKHAIKVAKPNPRVEIKRLDVGCKTHDLLYFGDESYPGIALFPNEGDDCQFLCTRCARAFFLSIPLIVEDDDEEFDFVKHTTNMLETAAEDAIAISGDEKELKKSKKLAEPLLASCNRIWEKRKPAKPPPEEPPAKRPRTASPAESPKPWPGTWAYKDRHGGNPESQFISWGEWKEIGFGGDADMEFTDCTLQCDLGPYKKGDKVHQVTYLSSRCEMEFYRTPEQVHDATPDRVFDLKLVAYERPN